MSHDIIPDILPDITPDIGSEMISYLVQDGLVPPLDKEASGIITVSEEIIKAYASKHSLNARAINDLIKDVLKNPAFNADEVDTDMLKRLQASIDSGDIQIINMTVEGDGDQVLELFKRPVEKVLRKLRRTAFCTRFGNLSCLAGLRISVPRDLNTVILTLSRRLHTAQTTRTYF